MKHIANILTISRMIFSLLLLTTEPLSGAFYILYALCGITDMTDGTAARLTNSVSRRGELLDSAADIVFVICTLVTLVPAVRFPAWVIVCTAVIALIRLLNLIYSYISFNRLLMLHTLPNKITGAVIFLIPFTLRFKSVNIIYLISVLCAIIASLHEGYMLKMMKQQKNIDNQ